MHGWVEIAYKTLVNFFQVFTILSCALMPTPFDEKSYDLFVYACMHVRVCMHMCLHIWAHAFWDVHPFKLNLFMSYCANYPTHGPNVPCFILFSYSSLFLKYSATSQQCSQLIFAGILASLILLNAS